jgi:hypothetical protein
MDCERVPFFKVDAGWNKGLKYTHVGGKLKLRRYASRANYPSR